MVAVLLGPSALPTSIAGVRRTDRRILLAIGLTSLAFVLVVTWVGTARGAPTQVHIRGVVQTNQQHGTLDNVLTWAQIVGVAFALGGLVYLARYTAATRKLNQITLADSKIHRTVTFQDHYTRPDFAAVASRVKAFLICQDADDALQKIRAFLRAPHAEKSCLPRTPRDPTAPMANRLDIQTVFGFYENVGAAEQLDQLNDDAFYRTFGPVPAELFSTAWWFVCWIRDGAFRPSGREMVFSEFEDLVRRTFEREPRFRQELKPNPDIRMLVVPADKDDDVWELCGNLSRALSNALRANPESLAPILALAPGQPDPAAVVSRVIAVPSDLGLDEDQWREFVEKASTLEKHLRAMTRHQLESFLATYAEPAE
jgi:hypothetical protein